MKQRLYSLLCLFLAAGLALSAQTEWVKMAPKPAATSAVATEETAPLQFPYCAAAYYKNLGGGVTDYYLVLSSAPATYDGGTGELTFTEGSEGWAVVLDFYAPTTDPVALSEGTYAAATDTTLFTYNPDFSSVYYLTATSGKSYNMTGSVQVTKAADGQFHIAFSYKEGKVVKEGEFTGTMSFRRQPTINSPYPLIGQDLDLQLTGAMGLYEGNFFQSKTGNILLNLYDCDFDQETGSHTGVGFCVQMCLFNTLFGDASEICLKPGTYTMQRSFNRLTWYPGLVVDYMGQTVVMGSFCQQRKADSTLAVAYVAEGLVDVAMTEDSIYTVRLDLVTDDGYFIRGTYTGPIRFLDESQDMPSSCVSTLTQDYELDLAQIPVARLWKEEAAEGCSHYYLDIGSPSGRDQVLVDNGGDIFRIDMLVNLGDPIVSPGTYTVMEKKDIAYYAPFRLLKGYFANGGDLCGTRWFHFAEGRYLVADGLAPAEYGTVVLKRNYEADTWSVDIDIIDDGGYNITGKWTGPIELMYEVPEGIEHAATAPEFTYADAETILLGGVRPADSVRVFTPDGACLRSATGCSSVSLSGLPRGMYLIRVGNRPAVKVVKR